MKRLAVLAKTTTQRAFLVWFTCLMPGKDVILQRIERRQEKGGMVKPVERDTTFPLGFSSQRIPTQEPRLGRYSGRIPTES